MKPVMMLEQHVSNMQMWPLMNILDQSIRSQVHLVFAFGVNATEVIFTTMDKKVYALGCNNNGCFGCGDTESSLRPRKINELDNKKIVDISAGSGPHVVVLTDEGEVYSWGHNVYTQIGSGVSTVGYSPFLVSKFINTRVTRVACGSYHTLTLTENGEVYAWGYNSSGQIGSGSTSTQSTPRKVLSTIGQMRMIDIGCCQNTSFALSCNGEVYCWGYNGNGQLGIGNCANQANPVKVTQLESHMIKKVACGFSHVFALSDEGQLFGWGSNSYGQLGIGNKTSQNTPVRVAVEVGHIVSVAATHYSNSSAAQNLQGQVFMWGHLRSQAVLTPVLTHFSNLNAVFASFSSPPVSWQPMQMGGDSKPTVKQSLSAAFNDEASSDLKILVEGKMIYVHKAVLKIRCDYFSRMFQSHWDENEQKVIQINEYSYNVVFSFLRYLYTDHVELEPHDAIGLLDLATSYCEDGLKWHCQRLIKESINIENAALLYSASIMYNAAELQRFCFQFCQNHMTQVVQTENFKLLEKQVMLEFITNSAQNGAFKK